MSIFRLPDLGEGVREAELVAWHVAVGDRVVADQPLVSVETDKAVVEIPAPQSGEIGTLHGAAGDIIAVGDPLVDFGGIAAADAGAVVGDLPTAPPSAVSTKPPLRRPSALAIVKAAPAARKLAAELGVDVSRINGEGPGGLVMLSQIRALAPETTDGGPPTGEALRGPRRAMAAAMARARDLASPATLTDDADISAWKQTEDPTVRLVQAIVAGCAAEPVLNSWLDVGAQTMRRLEDVDIALAVDTNDGLFAPVLRGAQTLSKTKIRAEVSDLVARAQSRRLTPDELKGATITLSNFGVLGGRYAQLVVSPPQVAILGAGVIADRPVVKEGKIAAARLMPLSLTFDHRAVTGGEAARFMGVVKANLENARRKGG